MAIQTLNPYTEKIEKTYAAISSIQASKKIEAAHEAHMKWKLLSVKQRAKFLRKVALNLSKNKEEYAKVISKEMGKPIKAAASEISKCALNCNFYAYNTEKFLKAELHDTEFRHARVEFEPLGVLLGVMPWNFPFWQVFRFAAPALMAGNAVVLKHASNVPECALLIEKIFKDSGLPKNLFVALLVESSQVEEVIRNPLVKAVTLTGSEAAGSKVASIAGSEIKKAVLELGGSDPFIILKGADLKKAVPAAIESRMSNAGQVCVAGKRLIVDKDIYDEVVKMVVLETKKLRVGDPKNEDTDIGPLAKKDILDEVLSQVKKTIQKGAMCLLGGNIIKGKGYFFEPTVLSDVRRGMPAYDAEIFGPVIAIIKARSDEDAVAIANDHVYGLGAAVWCKNEKRAFKVARQIEAGIVAINGIAKSDPRFPFGGTKRSGFGRELGSYGIKEFVNIKTIIAN